ncbi:hypothetical protein VCHA50P417_20457 [Vibrio chagasii]|nr:hypothetical protein VCHA50P417_20457 [Vibrio chagasii]
MCTKCLAKIAELIEGGIVNLETAGCKVIFPKMALIDELSAITYDAENKQLIISELPEKLIEEVEGYLESKQPKNARKRSSINNSIYALYQLEEHLTQHVEKATGKADSGIAMKKEEVGKALNKLTSDDISDKQKAEILETLLDDLSNAFEIRLSSL